MSKERRRNQRTEVQPEVASERPVSGKKIVVGIFILAAGLLIAMILYRQSHRYDAFAKCLKDRHVLMYGAYWCPHCVEQKEKFGASFKYAPYVECGIPGNTRGEQQVCKDAGIQHFPTWQFPPVGERVSQVLSLEDLSDRTGCSLP
ncbi:MAG TPA: hypothetical protein VMT53_05040 [Terriglobales bacterium]|nr:hypothetical protein [Terriglobales bacterium]